MARIAVFGATSTIAEFAARVYAGRGDDLFLVGRKPERLKAIAADLRLRGARSACCANLDFNDIDRHGTVLDHIWHNWAGSDGVDIAIIAHGSLPDQAQCDADVETAMVSFATNGSSTIALMIGVAQHLEKQGHGRLAVISSVAGDRGRSTNYLYGAAKSAVSAFASGLRQRLAGTGVHIITIKPGPVDTPMTAGMRKGLLWATPESVGQAMARAIDRGNAVAYLPRYWAPIMAVIRSIPEPIFKRLKL